MRDQLFETALAAVPGLGQVATGFPVERFQALFQRVIFPVR
jgi:hypothetical protein